MRAVLELDVVGLGRRLDDLRLPALQLADPRAVARHEVVRELGRLGRAVLVQRGRGPVELGPPLQDQGLVRHVLDELERPGPDQVELDVGAVLLDGLRGLHAEVGRGQVGQQRRVGLVQCTCTV